MDTGPDFYEIRVSGHLARRWTSWLGQLALQHEEGGTTLLSGHVPDQSGLYGILNQINNLGLTLISVNRLAVYEEPLDTDRPGGDDESEVDIHSTQRRSM